MKNIECNDAQVKQTPDECIWSAIRSLDLNKRHSGNGFAVTFTIVVAVLIWGSLLIFLLKIEFS